MPGLLILCATEFEVADFLKEFPRIRKEHLRSGGALFKAERWHCLITGPGVFNTALVLGAYLERFTPGVILDTGIAGVFEGNGLKPGDIVVASREQYLHTGVGNDALTRSPLPFELIPGRPETARGIYELDSGARQWQNNLSQALKPETAIAGSAFTIGTGPFLTVSAITRGADRAAQLRKKFSPVMESMEGAAAAHCACRLGIPMAQIRAASNFVGERDKSHWDFPTAVYRVGQICRAAQALSGEPGPKLP